MSRILPILFSAPMVQSLMAGRKTMTRRIIYPQPILTDGAFLERCAGFKNEFGVKVQLNDPLPRYEILQSFKCKYDIGDILWVRETLYQEGELYLCYDADEAHIDEDVVNIPADFPRIDVNGNYKFCKIPNIFMPKWACRTFLRVTDVRVEQLHDISNDDCIAEGIRPGPFEDMASFQFYPCGDLRDNTYVNCPNLSFYSLWECLHGVGSWAKNPWVFVYTFQKVKKPENFPG